MIAASIEFLKIVLLSITAAVVYGILHDQVTARICVEYFTIAHPPMFDTDSPTLLAFGWGTIATWWVGFLLGVPAAMLATFGRAPRLPARRLVRPLGVLLGVMACLALMAGVGGYFAAEAGWLDLSGPLGERIAAEKHSRFFADAAAHLASYGMGFFGGIGLCYWIWWQRRRVY